MFNYNGFIFKTGEEVYPPSEDSFLLLENIEAKASDEVLEVGTGCGFIIIQIAGKVKKAVATDINPKAIKTAEFNARLNKVENLIEFRVGDLFEPVKDKERFDLIIFNPPYLPTAENDVIEGAIDSAWNGGLDGREVITRFVKSCRHYLKPKGRVFLLQSSLSGLNETVNEFKISGLEVKVLATRSFFYEKLIVLKAFER